MERYNFSAIENKWRSEISFNSIQNSDSKKKYEYVVRLSDCKVLR